MGNGRPVSIVNRRNALAGWLALRVGKRFAKRKARRATDTLAFWRRPHGARKLLTR
jgi:hypothetical protein